LLILLGIRLACKRSARSRSRRLAGPPLHLSNRLPVKLEAHLDLPWQDVLGGDARREDRAEVAVRVFRIGVERIAPEVVVVRQVECLEAKLQASPLADLGGLQQRSIPLVGMMLTDLAGAIRRESRRIIGRRFEPGIIAPVGAEVRTAAEFQAGCYRSDRAVVVLLQHTGVPAAYGVGLPIGRTAEAATGSGRILELDHVAGKIGRESGG